MPAETPTPGSGRVDVRRDRVHSWIAYWILYGLLLLLPVGLAAGARYAAVANGNVDDPSGDLALFGVLGAVLLVLALALAAAGPYHLARQGLEVGDRGVGIVRERLWWARGGTVFVPWKDVHAVVGGVSTGNSAARTLEIHLKRADRVADPVVRWAVLVPAGHGWKGTTAPPRPRIVLRLDRPILERIEEEFDAWRPGTRAGGTSPEAALPPAAPAAAGAGRRVDMRWQHAGGWLLATGLCLHLTAGLTVLTGVTVVLGEYGAAVLMLFLAVVLGLVCRPLLRMAPRYTTAQAVVLDGDGITLVQEPRRAFPGVRAHVPWSQVRGVGQDVGYAHLERGRRVQYFVDVVTEEPLHSVDLPHWAYLDGSELRIRPTRARHGELVRAFRAARPDLLPGG
ncbi:hypothetical protein SUDANB121_05671 [Nocardiopsis dassonvillei]|uniref:hypothetical protein n=1 Tax=Nocardiopsis dassonvillei TaxID=2014 RepID=UPI003F5536C4